MYAKNTIPINDHAKQTTVMTSKALLSPCSFMEYYINPHKALSL